MCMSAYFKKKKKKKKKRAPPVSTLSATGSHRPTQLTTDLIIDIFKTKQNKTKSEAEGGSLVLNGSALSSMSVEQLVRREQGRWRRDRIDGGGCLTA